MLRIFPETAVRLGDRRILLLDHDSAGLSPCNCWSGLRRAARARRARGERARCTHRAALVRGTRGAFIPVQFIKLHRASGGGGANGMARAQKQNPAGRRTF